MDRSELFRNRIRWILFLVISLGGLQGCGSPGSRRSNYLFDDTDAIGSLPAGWQGAETNSKGTPAVWEVVDDKTASDGVKAVAITKTQNTGQTFNLLISNSPVQKDVTIRVKVKALAGKEDQGGGPVWRYQDNTNYYIARWNPLEKSFRLYVVKDGKRIQLGSLDVQVDPSAWHTISVTHKGNRIRAIFDKDHLIQTDDDTFSTAGKIGLWTKADAATAFDAFRIY